MKTASEDNFINRAHWSWFSIPCNIRRLCFIFILLIFNHTNKDCPSKSAGSTEV